jgi:alpha-beta hydrolase superfamily lysophospholipase
MNPLFFGSQPRVLFGVYHPPAARVALGQGVVLCYPFGQEYMRAHRAFRQLAMMLSRKGFHVFRFDYYGTGDSAGAGEEVTVDQWVEDVGTAVDELKDTAGLDRVSLVGLRLGAALATLAASCRTDIESLVLWSPVVDGGAYLTELREARGSEAPAGAGDTVNVLGFPLTPALEAGLGALALADVRGVRARRSAVIHSDPGEPHAGLLAALRAEGVVAGERRLPSSGRWAEVDTWGSALIPHALIQGVVDFLSTTEQAA